LSTLTAEKKAEAQRENDLIYNAVPVAEATLPLIDKLVVANPIPIQEIYGNPDVQKVIGTDIFVKLIPLSVHKSASVYSEEKAKLVRAEVEKSEGANSDLAVALASLGLPSGLQKWKDLVAGAGGGTGEGGEDSISLLPKELETWAEEIGEAGGVARIDELLSKLGPSSRSVTDEIDAVGRELENESKECERMRVSFDIFYSSFLVVY
jgi:hypothetical protein